MRAILATPALVDTELPEPTPGPHDLLVRIEAVAVNPIDTKMRAAVGAGDPPRQLGWDAAGVGSIAIQLARRAGAVVIVRASRTESAAWPSSVSSPHSPEIGRCTAAPASPCALLSRILLDHHCKEIEGGGVGSRCPLACHQLIAELDIGAAGEMEIGAAAPLPGLSA
ncbi:alcohol dehydrogenase catalytic domain-containing protein [Synechococcus sp. BA-132 BA5]|uniref:alcohol dehydrogenase catalytic domain-containing protein n=1 Tax=Synechococcus sp. BA-132 BA5 TaxID=3110252 RepID=UPI002B203905|nr:hypothetical protein [Synechococcus sp. BA-132 BA5]MEA5414016.1 hypothetical protein [Synechococcus sp. BA-132 BA5]